ncbi:hypothetical protein DPMN_187628 [Dreissena polymorpha]|uniref:Uncharacterized protein n=1 Tax=Dreissena polymorpha TaxID=45954 RepID=A0A9D4DQZ5_DREPO|nr:hypothetical protein DPMN_187628 [Dreissena polymorpha]
MARQRPTRLVMGPCIAEIDRIVIREVHHQLEVNWCRNEEVIGAPGLVIVPCIVEIDRIVIREVQYQFEVNRCRNEEIIVKGNFGRVWSMWAGRPRIDCIVIREVQYQFEVNRCRNEEIIVKAILGGCGLVMGPCIVEIDPNVIREVHKGNFWWVWPMWAGAPGLGLGPCMVEIDRIVIREVQYQFEVNRCRNKEVNFQGSMARTDGQTDGRTAEITTISPPFFQKAWG